MEDKANMYPSLPAQVPHQQIGPIPPPSYDQTYPIQQGQPSAPYNPQNVTPVIQMINAPSIPPLGPHPVNLTCPNCGTPGQTEVRYENGTKTHVMALVLCLFGLCCCACIPYCVDSCRNANHYCKNCQQYLGTHANSSC